MRKFFGCVFSALLVSATVSASAAGVTLEGRDGPGKGKHVVLIAGDDEYRSEELIPQLARILAERQGFRCTVLFTVNPETGEIDPGAQNLPGVEALDSADLMILFTRFRELPDDQMKHIDAYINSGKPMMGLRTATHAFNYSKNKSSPFAKYTFNNKDQAFQSGFGRQVLGETWINHFGHHNVESTRGLVAKGQEKNPIVRGCADIWGPSDVYGLTTLQGDCTPVVMGQVLTGMNPTDGPNTKKELVPVAWTKTYTGTSGKAARVFTTTMGHAHDLKSEGFRRLLVNASLWCVGLENAIPEKANVECVGKYDPNPIGMKKFKPGMKPADAIAQ